MIKYLLLILLVYISNAHASEMIDLTHPFNDKTIYWPTAPGFKLNKVFWGFTQKNYFYSSNTLCAPEHGGTHLDAPIHFAKGKRTVEQIPLDQLIGEAAVIDVRQRVGDDADYRIMKEDIVEWEKKNGSLTSNDIVFFNTGWARFWDNKKKYLGTDKMGDIHNLHFPGLSREAAQYLVIKKIKGVGLDTPSLDYGPSQEFWAHRILLKANIYGLENVAHVDKLPPRGAKLIVAPMKIEEGTGAPVRIFAELP